MIRTPVRIRGVDYPSVQSAADAFGLHQSTISAALSRGKVDRVGMPPNRHGNRNARRRAVIVGRVEFESVTDMARKLGVARPTAQRWTSPAATAAERDIMLRRVMEWHAKESRK